MKRLAATLFLWGADAMLLLAVLMLLIILSSCTNPAPNDAPDPATWPPPALTQSNIEGVRQASFGASITQP